MQSANLWITLSICTSFFKTQHERAAHQKLLDSWWLSPTWQMTEGLGVTAHYGSGGGPTVYRHASSTRRGRRLYVNCMTTVGITEDITRPQNCICPSHDRAHSKSRWRQWRRLQGPSVWRRRAQDLLPWTCRNCRWNSVAKPTILHRNATWLQIGPSTCQSCPLFSPS